MKIQKSYKDSQIGKLYVVPTPIGNMDDMTFRAIKTLNMVEMIAAEDTRHTRKLLSHFDIKTDMTSYHQHNEKSRTETLLSMMKDGKDLALVSDAGMPAISDPGDELIRSAIEGGIDVIVLPGANAALCALVGSGLPAENFFFYGFLPRKKGLLTSELEKLSQNESTIIFYESPFRLKQTLLAINKSLGNRQLVIAREITKVHEEFIRGDVKGVIEWLEDNPVKGECCIILEGNIHASEKSGDEWWRSLEIDEHVAYYESEKSLSHKEALKKVALDRKIPKKEVYAYIHVDK